MAGVTSTWWPWMMRFMLHSCRCAPAGPATGVSRALAQRHRRDLQSLAVLGDGTSRDHQALLGEKLRDAAVRQRFPGVFVSYQLLDQGADRRAGGRAAGVGRHVAAEEVLQLEHAERR